MERLADFTARAETQEKALAFTRYAIALMLSKGDIRGAAQVFTNRWPQCRAAPMVRKAAVTAGSTAGWGGPLAEMETFADGFLALLRPATILGRLTGIRNAPFNVRIPLQTAGASVGWVGQGASVKASALALNETTIKMTKVAGIVAVSSELIRSSDPAAEELVQADLIAGIAQFSDEQLLNPAKAEVADVSPASITNGVTPIASTGDDTDAVVTDLQAAFAAIVTGGAQLIAPAIIMKPTSALRLAAMSGPGGGQAFPGLGVNGGTIWGVPVITSASVGDRIVVLDAAEMILADGGVELDASGNATIELDTAPTNPTTAAGVVTSLWQMNLIGIMAKRYVYWRMRRPGAVSFISGVTY